MPPNFRRKSPRLKDFDYSSPGAYFVTMVTHNREMILGQVLAEAISHIELSPAGKVVLDVWNNLPRHYTCLSLGEMVIMPNHVHSLIYLGEGSRPLPEIIRAWKSFSSRRISKLSGVKHPVWQRSYYERVIRGEADWQNARLYICANPSSWAGDEENHLTIR